MSFTLHLLKILSVLLTMARSKDACCAGFFPTSILFSISKQGCTQLWGIRWAIKVAIAKYLLPLQREQRYLFIICLHMSQAQTEHCLHLPWDQRSGGGGGGIDPLAPFLCTTLPNIPAPGKKSNKLKADTIVLS